MSLRVLIAGGGLGGLTLAHGLRRAGLDVAVFERSQSRSEPTNGYRIHIDATGSRALHACLPPRVWDMVVGRSAIPPRGIAFVTERLHRLAFFAEPDPALDPLGHSHPISRAGLRHILLTDLDDVVAFDKQLLRYDRLANGQVVAHFADGSTAQGDVLVGAEGSTSTVRKQLLPHARVVDTGVGGIAGKLYLTERTLERVPAELLGQMTMVLPSGGLGMFMAGFRSRAGQWPTDGLDLPDHLFWVLIGNPNGLGVGRDFKGRSSTELQQIVLRHVERWDPLLAWLVAESDPSSLIGVPLHRAQPVAGWQTSTVTLLGDAIHTMPPLQGLGGNTALRDAARLCRHLVEADRGSAELIMAIRAYETAMLDYGFEAVRRSVQMSDGISSTSRIGRMAFTAVLRMANRFPRLGRVLFERHASASDLSLESDRVAMVA